MFYAAFKDSNGNTQSNLYHDHAQYFSDTFSPETTFICFIPFIVKGRTYAERKDAARQLAIDFQAAELPGLSWGEIADIQAYFQKIGSRYGLLSEFRANAIC